MLRVERNASGIDDEYLDALNECFPGAWNLASYRWYVTRPFRSRRPDTLTVHDGSTVAAGLTVNYRQLRSHSGVHDVGVLTAGWTRPGYRRRGCYSRLLDAAIRIASDNGCAALLGFSTAANTSGAALRRIGAYDVPTRYLFLRPHDRFAPPPSRLELREVAIAPPTPAGATSGIAFHYETPDDWAEQFVRRPEPTTVLEIDGRAAVVEHAGTTQRLQFLSGPEPDASVVAELAGHAREQGKHFFYFTTDARHAERAAGYGISQTAGTLLLLDLHNARGADCATWRASRWLVQPGDRM